MNDAVREVAEFITTTAPDGWRRIELTYYSTVAVDAAEILVTVHAEPERVPVPMKVAKIMGALRTRMYEKDRGSWFTARLVVEPDGRHEISYDYDSEPRYVPPLTPGTFALDFEHFPRSPDNTPEWLRDKLAEAAR